MNADPSTVQPYRTIPDAKWVAAVVSSHYDLSIESCRLLLAGVNDHFVIETQRQRLAVRVYRTECMKDQIQAELSFLDHLRREGASVASAVPAKSGELLINFEAPEGSRYMAVFTWAHGRVQRDEDAWSFGEGLARLHEAADGFERGGLMQLDLREAVRVGGAYLRSLPSSEEDRELLPDALERVERNLDLVLSSDPDAGGCHGDSHAGNANVKDGGTVTFFDFDFCCTGPRAYDLATYRWSNEVCDTHSDDAWEQVCSGYSSVRSLPDSEIRNALLLRPVRHLWWLGFWQANENRFGISMFLRESEPTVQIQRLMNWTQPLPIESV